MATRTRARPVKRATGTRATGTKAARRKAGIRTRLVRLSRSPLAREMATAAVVAAAGVLVRNRAMRAAAGKLGEGAREAATDTIGVASRLGQGIASMVSSAAHRFQADHDEDRVPTRQPARPKPPNGAMPYIS